MIDTSRLGHNRINVTRGQQQQSGRDDRGGEEVSKLQLGKRCLKDIMGLENRRPFPEE